MEHATALAASDATTQPVVDPECRFAKRHPEWHVCVRNDGQPIRPGMSCSQEAAEQLAEQPQNCPWCGYGDPDFVDAFGVVWHDGCYAEARTGDPDQDRAA